MRRKVLLPGGCVCTLHVTLGLAALFLTFKINFNIKKCDYAGKRTTELEDDSRPPNELQTIRRLFFCREATSVSCRKLSPDGPPTPLKFQGGGIEFAGGGLIAVPKTTASLRENSAIRAL